MKIKLFIEVEAETDKRLDDHEVDILGQTVALHGANNYEGREGTTVTLKKVVAEVTYKVTLVK